MEYLFFIKIAIISDRIKSNLCLAGYNLLSKLHFFENHLNKNGLEME